MASITFSGQLDQAMNEAAAEGNKILFIPQQTVGEVLPGAASELVVESDGSYSITLAYNTYSIYHYSDLTKRRTKIADGVVVSADTSVSTIPDLIGSTVPVTEDSVLTIQGYLTEAQDSVAAAAASEAAVTNRVAAYEVESTEYLINTFDGSALEVGDVVRTLGYYTAGDGGGAEWVKTGETSTVSQSPSDLIDSKLTDVNGNIFSFVVCVNNGLTTINPLSLGADNAGLSDSTNAIQAAINSALGSGWSCVYLSAGKYLISKPLEILGGKISIKAVPATVELIQTTVNESFINIGDGTSESRRYGPVIEGVNFVANPTETTEFTEGACIYGNYVYKVQIRDCVFYGKNSDGDSILYDAINIVSGIDCKVSDCRIENFINDGWVTSGTNTTDLRSVDCAIVDTYIINCGRYSCHINEYSEAGLIDNVAITNSGTTPIVINSNATTQNGILHMIRRPNVEASGAATTGIDIYNSKKVTIEGGWVGNFTNSIRLRSGAFKCNVNGTEVDGRILVEGAKNKINARIENSSSSDSNAITFTSGAEYSSFTGYISDFTGGAIEIEGDPAGLNIGPVIFNTVTGGYISGGDFSGGPLCVGLTNQGSGTTSTATASSSLTLQPGNDFFSITGEDTISNITIHYPQRRIYIQASGGPINFDDTGNIRTTSTSYSSGKVIELVCDHSTWFEVGSNA